MLPAAKVQTEYAEWLLGEGRDREAEELLVEARTVFERLQSRPWLERIDAALPRVATMAAEAQ